MSSLMQRIAEAVLDRGKSRAEVKHCLVTACDLYPFRLGTNPWRPEASEATREVRRRNVARIRQPVNIAE